MNSDCFFRVAAAEHFGYIKSAVQKRAHRINKKNTPTLRDQVRHLGNCCGAYLVGSCFAGLYGFDRRRLRSSASYSCRLMGSPNTVCAALNHLSWVSE